MVKINKNCKAEEKNCDTCYDRFRCWTTRDALYFLIRRGDGITPHICFSIAGRYEYNEEEFTVALKDCEDIQQCFSRYTYTIETALNIEQLIKLGYTKC